MQVTIDIPDTLYARLESRAQAESRTLETLMLDGASRMVADKDIHLGVVQPTLSSMDLNLNDFTLMGSDEIAAFEEHFARAPESAVREFGIRRLSEHG